MGPVLLRHSWSMQITCREFALYLLVESVRIRVSFETIGRNPPYARLTTGSPFFDEIYGCRFCGPFSLRPGVQRFVTAYIVVTVSPQTCNGSVTRARRLDLHLNLRLECGTGGGVTPTPGSCTSPSASQRDISRHTIGSTGFPLCPK